jgi:hypothetical protein
MRILFRIKLLLSHIYEYIFSYEKPKPPTGKSNAYSEFLFLCEHK